VLFVVFAVAMWRRKHDEDEEAPRKAADGATFWRATAAVFGVVFVAEWGDLPLPPQPRRPYGLHP
jgi:putative Ca2+/H+ antiporter (TMEM165/GDT1 family)